MKIKIGNIEIDDLELQPSGIYRYKKKIRRRGTKKIRHWSENTIILNNKIIYNLLSIAEDIHNAGYRARQFEMTVLRDIIKQMLDCNENTAYAYAIALMVLNQ